jgi:hypothetical protein
MTYPQLLLNNVYHSERKKLELDERYARVRFLDPGNPKSGKKTFYSEAILGALAEALNLADQGGEPVSGDCEGGTVEPPL